MTVATDDLSSLLKTAEILQVTGLSPSESTSNMQSSCDTNAFSRSTSPFKSSKTSNIHPQSTNSATNKSQYTPSTNSQDHGLKHPSEFMDVDLACVKEVCLKLFFFIL